MGGGDVGRDVSNSEPGTFRAALKESFVIMHLPSCCLQPVCCYFRSVEIFEKSSCSSCNESRSKQMNKQNSKVFIVYVYKSFDS